YAGLTWRVWRPSIHVLSVNDHKLLGSYPGNSYIFVNFTSASGHRTGPNRAMLKYSDERVKTRLFCPARRRISRFIHVRRCIFIDTSERRKKQSKMPKEETKTKNAIKSVSEDESNASMWSTRSRTSSDVGRTKIKKKYMFGDLVSWVLDPRLTDLYSTPTMISKPLFGINAYEPDIKVEKIFCGISHLEATTNQRHLFMWGHKRYGALGLGHRDDQYFPFKIVLDQHPTASPEKSEMWGEPSSPSYIFNSPIFLYLLSYF
ncbi:unnamed protein product, partial [Trichogramma brassicae]